MGYKKTQKDNFIKSGGKFMKKMSNLIKKFKKNQTIMLELKISVNKHKCKREHLQQSKSNGRQNK